MSGIIDPTVTANYPVVLGDGLLGKNPNEIFTGVKYNHRPNKNLPANSRLKPSLPGSTSSYDLAYSEDGKQYTYEGTRNTDDHQYVLYFSPERKAFILDRIDSTFNMNLTRMPGNSDPDSLRKLFPHIGSEINSATAPADKPRGNRNLSSKEAKKRAAAAVTSHKKSPLMPAQRKTEKKASKNLALPEPVKPKAKPAKKKADYDDEDEEEDDDGGLLIEYPDAPDPKSKATDFSPAFASVRRFDEFMDARESEGDDADGESEDEPDILRLPSPVNHSRSAEEPEEGQKDVDDTMEVDDAGRSQDVEEEEDENMEADLEKELANAFEDYENSNQGTPAAEEDDESEISEED